MRIHSDTLTADDVRTAATYAAAAGHGRVYVDSLTEHGSRSRRRAFDVKLTGDGSHSRRRTNGGTRYTDHGAEREYAATYDSWGYFFARIFADDPHAKCWAYDGADDFHARTDHKYRAPSHAV